MDNEAWIKGEEDKAWSIKSIKALNFAEVIAEYLPGMLMGGIDHKRLAQVLMVFEMAKVAFRFKFIFSGSETLVLGENIFTYYMADKHRRKLLRNKAENVLGLFKLQALKTSPDKIMELVYKTLGMKAKTEKTEIKTNEDGSPAESGPDNTENGRAEDTTVIRNDALVRASENDEELNGGKKSKYVIDKESLVDSFCFNEELELQLPRSHKKVSLLRSLPIPQRLMMEKLLAPRIKVSECLYILRPLFYCMMLSLYDEKSYKPLIFSLVVDAAVLLLKIGFKYRSIPEIEELRARRSGLIFMYLFRKPLYTDFTKPRLIEPILKKMMPIETIRNLIIQALDYRSSMSQVM